MSLRFPTHPAEIPAWAQQESVSLTEAARKYAQYLILQGISESNPLRTSLVFKGGNALDFVYLPNRSTVDLDFSFLEPESDIRSRSAEAYGQIADTTRHTFIPFDEAWNIVMDLVNQLDIPD